MVIEKRIKIKDVNYLLGIEVKYDKNGILVKKDNTYFDIGDFNKVISYVESNYDSDCIYDKNVSARSITHIFFTKKTLKVPLCEKQMP